MFIYAFFLVIIWFIHRFVRILSTLIKMVLIYLINKPIHIISFFLVIVACSLFKDISNCKYHSFLPSLKVFIIFHSVKFSNWSFIQRALLSRWNILIAVPGRWWSAAICFISQILFKIFHQCHIWWDRCHGIIKIPFDEAFSSLPVTVSWASNPNAIGTDNFNCHHHTSCKIRSKPLVEHDTLQIQQFLDLLMLFLAQCKCNQKKKNSKFSKNIKEKHLENDF